MRVALVGCGAVTQRNYLPALKQVSGCTVEWFADSNPLNAKRAAIEYGSGNVTSDYSEVINRVDAAIVAVPNYLHSKVSVDFLAAGRDVLCEKPIADTSDNALKMIQAGRKSGARLAINFTRRRFESYRVTRTLLRQLLCDKVRRIDYREGHSLTSWPFSSSYLLNKRESGGGVLIDWGAHKLDLLNWIFGYDWQLVSYKDDGLGRIESNCEIDFNINWKENSIPCHIELSYLRELGNKMVVNGDLSSIVVDETTNGVRVRVEGQDDMDIGVGRMRSYASYFADQIKSFISGTSDECLAGEDALNSLLFIEKCYEHRKNLSYPWEDPASSDMRQSISPRIRRMRILVVGASGFLGSRLAERLAVDYGLNVRATFHAPARATKIARLPVELVECNLLERDQVMQAVHGCDVIINCAVGKVTNPRDKATAMNVYVNGTRNLLEAAKKNGVSKFIQISTAAVLGFRHRDTIVDESFPFKSRLTWNFYEKGKISQEKLVMEYAASIPIVILRPTLIYGPFSREWAVDIVDRLVKGKPTLVENSGIANLVYVDDVVDAIFLALERDEANGKTLTINNDEDKVPWENYISEFTGLSNASPVVLRAGYLEDRFKKLVSICVDSLKAAYGNMRSREMLLLLARIPVVAVAGSKLLQSARREKIEESLVSSDDFPISSLRTRLTRYETIEKPWYENLKCHSIFSSALAKNTLQWTPQTRFTEGIRRTLVWADWAGVGQGKPGPS